MYHYKARLKERNNGRDAVYDGDTLWLQADLGFGVFMGLNACRLHGIDAPEMNKIDQKEDAIRARDFVREMLRPLDWFEIETFKDTKGKYGRYLVKIWLPDGRCLNDLLVYEGLAKYRDYS